MRRPSEWLLLSTISMPEIASVRPIQATRHTLRLSLARTCNKSGNTVHLLLNFAKAAARSATGAQAQKAHKAHSQKVRKHAAEVSRRFHLASNRCVQWRQERVGAECRRQCARLRRRLGEPPQPEVLARLEGLPQRGARRCRRGSPPHRQTPRSSPVPCAGLEASSVMGSRRPLPGGAQVAVGEINPKTPR